MDLLLRHATVIDGTGGPARPADVAVEADRIARVAPPGELAAAAGHRGRRPRRPRAGAGLHRHPHPLRRPDPVGRRPHPVELARGDQRGHGQLRLRRRPDPARAPRHDRAHARERRGHVDGGARRRHRLVLRDASPSTWPPSTSGPSASTSAPSSATRRCACSCSAGDGAGRHRRRGRGDAGDRARGHRGRRARVLDVAAAGPPGRLRPSGAQPLRRDRRGGRDRRRSSASWARASCRCRSGPGLFVDQFSAAVGAPRRPRHLDRARRPGGQARRRPAHGRAGRGAARRGLPADRLPPDRHADHP